MSIWQPIHKISECSHKAVVCIGKYPDSGNWTDPWRVIVNGVEGLFSGWPHPFPPTHFAHLRTPDSDTPPTANHKKLLREISIYQYAYAEMKHLAGCLIENTGDEECDDEYENIVKDLNERLEKLNNEK